MAHLSSRLPWDNFFNAIESPFLTSEKNRYISERNEYENAPVSEMSERWKVSRKIFAVKQRYDVDRMRYFIGKFREQLKDFARTERLKYPALLSAKGTRTALPRVHCEGCGELTYTIGAMDGDSMEHNRRYIQHFIQEENINVLLQIATMDPSAKSTEYHGYYGRLYDGSGYGYRMRLFYFELYFFMNIILWNWNDLKVKIDLYQVMERHSKKFETVKAHRVFKLLETNRFLEDHEINKEILQYTFKQLYLLELFTRELEFDSRWERAFVEFFFFQTEGGALSYDNSRFLVLDPSS